MRENTDVDDRVKSESVELDSKGDQVSEKPNPTD